VHAVVIADGARPHEYAVGLHNVPSHLMTRETGFLSHLQAGLKDGTFHGSYGLPEVGAVTRAVEAYASEVAGKKGMVLGTEQPWVEGILLNAGSAEVWTFEYASINSTHPQVSIL
jgi:hypothetical protein